ncbi:MAG: tetratricopeptide repeat protein [Chitinophagales bacterium]
MKKKFFTNLIPALFIVGALFLQACNNSNATNTQRTNSSAIPLLIERTAEFGSDEESDRIKTIYDNCLIALKNNPQDYKSYLELATVFITEGRITGNIGYYNESAMQMLDHIIDAKQNNKQFEFEALNYKAAVLLSMHQFQQAYDVAKQAAQISNRNSGLMGAMVDAYVELGKYDAAVKMCDSMINLKPDIRSYSRVSYLRQINGDNRGAIEAMTYAVGAGLPGAENTEWARVTLGDLFMNIGALDTAELLYKESLTMRPGYVYAEMGLAKIEKAKKNYDAAIQHCENAIQIISESSFITFMADCYLLKGDTEKAEEIYEDVYKLLEQAEKEQNKEEAKVKHNGARELAMAHMKAGNLDEALELAQIDLAMRPENIDANELIAWVFYLKGDYTNAKMHADKMLATNVKNANTLYKAGLIYTKSGDTAKGNELMAEAKSISTYIDPLIQ